MDTIINMNELKKAEQQLIGFGYASRGHNILDLVQSMGLTKQEWDRIKKKALYLKKIDIEEIEKYFDK